MNSYFKKIHLLINPSNKKNWCVEEPYLTKYNLENITMYTNKYFFLKIVVNRNKAQNIASMFKIYLLNKLRSICS